MGIIRQSEFSLGWQPSLDVAGAPRNALLRMDNCALEDPGIPVLRPGSDKINVTALADTDVHSLFTETISGTKTRFAGAGDDVYAGGVSILSGIAGSGDIAFGSHQGQVLMARSTTKRKYDGTTVRNWGIAVPTGTPTVSGLATDSKTFASGDSAESPAFTANEGTVAFAADRAGTANGAIAVTPNATTGRGIITKTFTADQNFTSYDGGQTGIEDDLIDLYLYMTEPQYITYLQFAVDVNGGGFQEDWYSFGFAPNAIPNESQESPILDRDRVLNFLADDFTVEGWDRRALESSLEDRGREPLTTASLGVGWYHVAFPRRLCTRFGSTSDKGWDTVREVRLVFHSEVGGSGAIVRWDNIRIIGGKERPLTGVYTARVVAVRNDGVYNTLSAPGTATSPFEVRGQAIRVTIASGDVSNLDGQVNELWLFLFGGHLDRYYRFTVKTGGPFTGAQTIDAIVSERSALTTNIPLETNNTVPPDNIIMIEGPHYDRTLALTATHVYPSRQRNPDSFSTDESIRVGSATETALWIKKNSEYIYIGTTKDIYRFDGDWTELPDTTINVAKRSLGVSRPPVSSAVAVGNINGVETLVYLTGSGWQILGGSLLVDAAIERLWSGETRHGVLGINITGSTARFRCAITKNRLFSITPEGTSATSSSTIHVYDFSRNRWYRWIYGRSWRSILAEQDGTLVSGDDAGFSWTLDNSTKKDDGSNIAVTLWTGTDDDGSAFAEKQPLSYNLNVDSGGQTITVNFHRNQQDSVGSITAGLLGREMGSANISNQGPFRQMQQRITGSFSTFAFRGYSLSYVSLPERRMAWDTGYVDLGKREIYWIRKIRAKIKTYSDVTVTPYFDGTADTARTININGRGNTPYVFEVGLGRQAKGRQPRVVLSASSAFELYWIELEYNESGKQRQKRIERFAGQ